MTKKNGEAILNNIELIVMIGVLFMLPFASPTGFIKLVLVAVGIYLGKRVVTKEAIYQYNKIDLYVFVLALAYGISTLFSSYQKYSILEYGAFGLTILFGVIVRNVISTELNIKYFLHAINVSALLVCIYGFYQAVYDKPMQKAWLDPNVRKEITFRVISTFENPNLLAIFIVLVTPVAIFMLFNEKKIITKIYFAVSIAVFVACLGLTFSRTGMLGLVAAVIVFIALVHIRYIVYLLIGGVCLFPFLPATMMSRIKSIGTGDSTVDYRFKVWETTMEMIQDHFMTGVGYGSSTYMEVYKSYLGRTKIVAHAHNIFLQIWAEAGIIGLLAFLLFMIQIYVQYVLTIIRSNDKFQKLMLALGVSVLTGLLVNGLSEYSLFYYKDSVMFYVIFFLTSQYLSNQTKTLNRLEELS